MERMEYKEYIALKSIFYFCSLPLRLDSYRGCSFKCKYCFSQRINNRSSNFFNQIIPANPLRFRLRMNSIYKKGENGVINSLLFHRTPIHFGSLSDPFQKEEKKYGISYEFLKILADHNYPTVISTKSNEIAKKPYIEIIKRFPAAVQISFSTFDEKLARKIEPNAPSPKDRIKVLYEVAETGIFTIARIQPYLFLNDKNLEQKIRTLSKIGVKHLILEHLRIPTNSSLKTRSELWQNLKIDYLNNYKEQGIRKSRINYELNTEQKLINALKIKEICHYYGVSFGSGDNDLHHISDDPCCCGISNLAGFENVYKGHFGVVAHNGINTGKLDLSIIHKNWQPKGSIREFINSDCRINKLTTPLEYLVVRLENNRLSNSLDDYYGIEFDPENGYHLNIKKVEKIRKNNGGNNVKN